MKHRGSIEWRSPIPIAFVIMIILSLIFPLKVGNANNLIPDLYPKESKPFNATYGEWIARYFNWSAQIPEPVHPREHYTPERCSTNQSSPVWFLGEIFVGNETRTCTIPSDMAILLPTQSGVCWNDGKDIIPMDANGALRCAMECDDFAMVNATIDGKFTNLESYRTQSPFFEITVVEDNVWGDPAGKFKGAVADGYFVFLEPLPPGNHTLVTKTGVSNPINPLCNIGNALTYNLIIKP